MTLKKSLCGLVLGFLVLATGQARAGLTNAFPGTVPGDGTGDPAYKFLRIFNTNDWFLLNFETEASNHWQTVTAGLQSQVDALVPGTNAGPSLTTVTNIARGEAASAVSTYAPTNGATLHSPVLRTPTFTGGPMYFTGDIDINGGLIYSDNANWVVDSGDIIAQWGTVQGAYLVGDGGGITGLNGSAITGGTIPLAVFPTTYRAPYATNAYYATNAGSATTAAWAMTADFVTHLGNFEITTPDSQVTRLTNGTMYLRLGGETYAEGLALGTDPDHENTMIGRDGSARFGQSGVSVSMDGSGNLTAEGTFSGDGSGLTGLPAGELTGTVPLAALSGITSTQMDGTTDAAYKQRGVMAPSATVAIGTNTVGNVEVYTPSVPVVIAASLQTTGTATNNITLTAVGANDVALCRIVVTATDSTGANWRWLPYIVACRQGTVTSAVDSATTGSSGAWSVIDFVYTGGNLVMQVASTGGGTVNWAVSGYRSIAPRP